MQAVERYENYPLWIVVVSNLVSWSVYVIGAIIFARLWAWLIVPYLLYCLWVESRVLKHSCVDCAYYGKTCAFGKGRLCAVLFERGDPARFIAREISWKAVLPDFLVPLIPLAGGIVLLILRGWDWLVVGLLLGLILLASVGSGFVRGSLACKHCRQRELGCPAEKLFGGKAND